MRCPSDEQLLRGLLGELSVNEARTVDRHSATCARCTSELDSQRALLSDLSVKPTPLHSEDVFTNGVMDAIRHAQSRPPARARTRFDFGRNGLLVATAIAAAALVAVLSHSQQQTHGTAREHVSARGATIAASKTPHAELFFVRDGVFSPLAGAQLRAGDALAVRASNLSERAAYLAVFAIDALGEVHWLYPAYVDASTTPMSIAVQGGTRDRMLDEVVEPDSPAPGRFRLFALFSSVPLDVLSVEAQRNAFLDGATPFPASHLQRWSSTWQNN
jgi:hypothetical protein